MNQIDTMCQSVFLWVRIPPSICFLMNLGFNDAKLNWLQENYEGIWQDIKELFLMLYQSSTTIS